MTLQADMTLIDSALHRIGARRIALLEAVGRTGSIAGAARQIGLSYKAAWDALEAMHHFTTQPVLQTTTGGRGGGGAQLTPAGEQLIEAWNRLQTGLAGLMQQFQNDLHEINPTRLVKPHDLKMRTSARNVFLAEVADIMPLSERQNGSDALLADVCLDLGHDLFIHSAITRKSVERLGLRARRQVHALIKASFVEIAPLDEDEAVPEPEKNRLCGTICDFTTDGHYTEMTVDLKQARTITATCSKQQAIEAGLKRGLAVTAQFSPADVILATY